MMDFSGNRENIYFDDSYCFNQPGIRRNPNRVIEFRNLNGQFLKKFTFSCWVKLDLFAGSFPSLVRFNSLSGYEFWLYWIGQNAIRCRMPVNSSVAVNGKIDFGGAATINTWHHVVLSVDQPNEIALYIDKNKFAASHPESLRHENNVASEGIRFFSGIDNNSYEPFGQLRDVYLFEQFAADQSDVDLLYYNKLTNANLHTYLKLNQKNGAQLRDSGGRNNHAYILNFEKEYTLQHGTIWKPIN